MPITPLRREARFLVVEGNTREGRERYRDHHGQLPSASYAGTVSACAADLLGEVTCDIAFPADAGANLPDAAGLESYDAVFLTGSALHVYDDLPEIRRQIDLMRAVYASGTPCFGSCWGLQIGTVAAGGSVIANPAGREVGFARRIVPTAAGRRHPLLDGRPDAFDAPASHLDAVLDLPDDAVVLARNALTPVQAAEIRHGCGVFWGVQYHPEFSLPQLASVLRLQEQRLVEEGFRRDAAALSRYAQDLDDLHGEPGRRDLAWLHGLDDEVLDPVRRTRELRNFLAHRVAPLLSARGRA